MFTPDDITEALRACYASAPGHTQPINIVDLGLVESVALAPDPEAPGANIAGIPPRHALTLTLILASPDEDTQAQLSAQIANRLAGLPELSRFTILFAASPTWTPTRISPAGRRLLQLDFPILNNRR
jgi:metal-sulfur cluster biosynthetic enzyme